MYPTSARTLNPSAIGSSPRTRAWPLLGASRPSRILISVLLPAPLAPTSPTMPGSTSTVRSASAVTPLAYRFVSSCVSMSATGLTVGAGRRPDITLRSGPDPYLTPIRTLGDPRPPDDPNIEGWLCRLAAPRVAGCRCGRVPLPPGAVAAANPEAGIQ